MNSFKSQAYKNHVRIGWFALHRSVCVTAANSEYGSYTDMEIYEEFLRPILDIAEVPAQAHRQDDARLGDRIWKYIQLVIRQPALNKNNAGVFERTSIKELPITYYEWARGALNKDLTHISLRDPLAALPIGWSLINDNLQFKDRYTALFWGLALIGWVSVIHSQVRVCKLCFRWTFYGSDHCFLHSQSKLLNLSQTQAHSRYRVAKQNRKFVKKEKFLTGYPHPVLVPSHRHSLIAECIFFDSYSESQMSEVYETLNICPLALSYLGGSAIFAMESRKLISHIRRFINPLEYFFVGLLVSIVYTEAELSLEKRTAGRPKGQSHTTSQLVDKAIELVILGSTKTEIATKLNIGKSTLSNWIKRYPRLEQAFDKKPNT